MKKLFTVFILILVSLITSCSSSIDNANENNTSNAITIDSENTKVDTPNKPNEHIEPNKSENWIFVERINANDPKILNDNYLIYENNERNIFLYNLINDQIILLDKNIDKNYYYFFYADNSLVYAISSVEKNKIKIVKWDITSSEKNEFEYHYNDDDYLVESIDTLYFDGKVYHAIQGLNGKAGVLIMKDAEIDEFSIDKSFDVVRSPKPLMTFDNNLYIRISNEDFYLFDDDSNNLIKTDSFFVKNNIKYTFTEDSLNILGENNETLKQFILPLRLESRELNYGEVPYVIYDLYQNKILMFRTRDSTKKLSIFVNNLYLEITNIDSLHDAKFMDDNNLVYVNGKRLFLFDIKKNKTQKISEFDDYIEWIKIYEVDSIQDIIVCTTSDVLYRSTLSFPLE